MSNPMSTRQQSAIGICSAAKQMPRLLLTSGLFFIVSWTETDLMSGFVRSLVICEVPLPDASGHCPKGSINHDGRCVAVSPHHDGWSGSSTCLDRAYVVSRGVEVGGKLKATDEVGQLIANVFISAAADTKGRKPVVLLALLGAVVNLCLLVVAAMCSHGHSMQLGFVFLGIFVAKVTDCFAATSQAMAADISKPQERSVFYAALSTSKTFGLFCGMGIGFVFLKMELEDYTMVWAGFLVATSIFGIVVSLVLQETMHTQNACISDASFSDFRDCRDEARSGADIPAQHNYCRKAMMELRAGWLAVRQDPILASIMCIVMLTSMAIFGVGATAGGWCMIELGFSQATASLLGVVNPLIILVGYALAARMSGRHGAYITFGISVAVMTLGLGILCFAAVLPPLATALFWFGYGVLALGVGLSIPTGNAIVSMRVASDLQGRVFAFSQISQIVGIFVGVSIWSNVLWTERARGLQAAVPFFASLLVSGIALIWFVAIHFRYGGLANSISNERVVQGVCS